MSKKIIAHDRTNWVESAAEDIVSRNSRTVTIQFHESFEKWVQLSVEIIKDLLIKTKDAKVLVVGGNKLSSIAMKNEFCKAFGLNTVHSQIVDELVLKNVEFISHEEIKNYDAKYVFIYSILDIPTDVLHDLVFSNKCADKRTILCKIVTDEEKEEETDYIWSAIHSEHNLNNVGYEVTGDPIKELLGAPKGMVKESSPLEVLEELNEMKRCGCISGTNQAALDSLIMSIIEDFRRKENRWTLN